MLVILDVDFTLNHFYPPSIRDFAPVELLENPQSPQMWDWIVEHLSTVEYPVREEAVAVLQRLDHCNPLVVVNTGRPEALRAATEQWLRKFFRFEHVFMRPNDDFRHNAEIKRDALTQFIQPLAGSRSLYAFEDDAGALAMYRETGVPTFPAPDCWGHLAAQLSEAQDEVAIQSIVLQSCHK
jgi:hypothetical protein